MTASALLVGDLQSGITASHAFAHDLVPVAKDMAAAARRAGALVVFVRTELRANGLDVAPRNPIVAAIYAAGDDYREGSTGTALDPGLEVDATDAVVSKRRASAFAGTDLDQLLRARNIGSLVITGVATSAMVTATVYDALDRDYAVTVVADACADPVPDVHAFLVETLFPSRGADVVSSRDWMARRSA